MVANSDYGGIGTELMLQPNMILSIINTDTSMDGYVTPLLFNCGQYYHKNSKIFDLVLSSIFHFSAFMLGETDIETNNNETKLSKDKFSNENINKNKRTIISHKGHYLFLDKYFNFNNCQYIINYQLFWGIELINSASDNKYQRINYDTISMIMSNNRFQGLSQVMYCEFFLHNIIKSNFKEYLEVIAKYFEKNRRMIKNGISNESQGNIFEHLLKQDHCSIDWLNLLLQTYESTISQEKNRKFKLDVEAGVAFCAQNGPCNHPQKKEFRELLGLYKKNRFSN